jgi:hypothetical protein
MRIGLAVGVLLRGPGSTRIAAWAQGDYRTPKLKARFNEPEKLRKIARLAHKTIAIESVYSPYVFRVV